MRNLYAFILAVLLSANAVGRPSEVNEATVKNFLSQNTPCLVSFAFGSNGNIINPIFCIWNGVYAGGTIRESHGCYFGRFDTLTGSYHPLQDWNAGLATPRTKGKKCTREVAEEILYKIPLRDFIIGAKNTSVMRDIKRQENKHNSLIVLYDEYGLLTPEVIDSHIAGSIQNYKVQSVK